MLEEECAAGADQALRGRHADQVRAGMAARGTVVLGNIGHGREHPGHRHQHVHGLRGRDGGDRAGVDLFVVGDGDQEAVRLTLVIGGQDAGVRNGMRVLGVRSVGVVAAAGLRSVVVRVPRCVEGHMAAGHSESRLARARDVQVRAVPIVRVSEVRDAAKDLQHHERYQQEGDAAAQTSLEGAAQS